MEHITGLDYVLLPLYLAFFYWRVKKMGNKLAAPELKKYLFIAFGLRMLGSVAYSMLIEYYYGYGDSFSFWNGGNFFTEQIAKNPRDIQYLFSSFKATSDWYSAVSTDSSTFFLTPSNNMVARISALLSYLSFHKYLIISLFFAFFSFLGQWKLFLVFDELNKHRNRKLLALTILCAPSIWFWSSGLLKDSICLGSMGYIVHILYRFFEKKKFSLTHLIVLIFLVYIVFIIKSYIISIFLAGFIIMAVSVFFKSISNKIFRAAALLLTILIVVFVLYESNFSGEIAVATQTALEQIKDFQHVYETIGDQFEESKSGFEFGELDGSLNNLILKSPMAVFTCLFRPFPWESRKIIIFFASIESMLLLLCTLFLLIKLGVIRVFRTIFTTPYLLFCFTISIFFALIIGFTTFNFGTMIRYKVIFIPFFYFLLVYLYSNYRESKKRKTG